MFYCSPPIRNTISVRKYFAYIRSFIALTRATIFHMENFETYGAKTKLCNNTLESYILASSKVFKTRHFSN